MKFILSFILIALLSFTACLYLPWWSIAVAAFVVTLIIPQNGMMSFVTGFCALFILWGGLCLWISSNNDHLLAHKMAVIIVKADNPYLLIVASALIGAVTGGCAAITGFFLRRLLRRSSKHLRDSAEIAGEAA